MQTKLNRPTPAARRPHPAARRARGFTLLEVLVALVIVGTALVASLRAVGSLSTNSSALRTAMMATWSAENRLVQIRLAKQFPAIGRQSFDCPQGDLQLICQEEVVASPNPRLRRVEVSVVEARNPQRRVIKLIQLVRNQ
ncbi:MAG: type II secretion system minor pseudopilin GspI [Pseudomonadota bacterium]